MYSAFVGMSARATVPTFLRRAAYSAFANVVGADLSEAEHELTEYRSLGEVFSRRLRPGLRVVESKGIVAPCDGKVAACGRIEDGTLIQAKGRQYTVSELVADDGLAEALADGQFFTIYLSPRDYHRVHAPVDGEVRGYEYLPGTLWPVSQRFVQRVDRLFARNERAVLPLHTAAGPVVVVLVGAAGVGNMWIALDDRETRSWRKTFGRSQRQRVELPPRALGKGDELGAFLLGSTVVVLLPRQAALGEALVEGNAVRMGQAVASWEAT